MSNHQTDSYFSVCNNEIEEFMERCMIEAGATPLHAKALASCLTAADYRGHYSHGLNRLGIYFYTRKNKILFFKHMILKNIGLKVLKK